MLRKTKTALLAALLVVAASAPVAAQDQEAGDIRVDLPARKAPARDPDEPRVRSRSEVGDVGPLRLYGGFNVAVGGAFNYDADGPFNVGGSADADPTVGLQFGVDYVLHKYFSLGGEMRFLFPKIDGAADREFFWDLVVKPRGRYAFDNIPLEVYGTLPIGLTVAALEAYGADGKAGFNVGLLAGANWFFTNHMAINAELGWQFHRVGVEAAGRDVGNLKLNQFVLLCPNFVYAF